MRAGASGARDTAGDVRVLFVDLNNFARYPTVAVGYLTAAMRAGGLDVDVFSPLSVGVSGLHRERRPRAWSRIEQSLRYHTAVSDHAALRRARAWLASQHGPTTARARARILREFRARFRVRPNVVLLSAYLMHFETCREIARVCSAEGVPVVVGGGYFSQPEIIERWLEIPGLVVVGGEAEPFIVDLARALAERRDVSRFPGVSTRDVPGAGIARPVRDLDALAFPDYSDFPWESYPHRIVPMITGRGCGWGACGFCSDVTSSAGRTFRSRSPENVLAEAEQQSRRHRASLFVFTDLKLNSSPAVWEALISRTRSAVPSARWVGAVHVGSRGGEGLGSAELRAAKASGLTRVTTGIESGSQSLLDAMKKGTSLGETSRFLTDACVAGISVRATMVLGHPGETAGDVVASAEFLERHEDRIDRVSLNRFVLVAGTALHRRLRAYPGQYRGLQIEESDSSRLGLIEHRYAPAHSPLYRRAVGRLIHAVHRINRRRLPPVAREFDGVM